MMKKILFALSTCVMALAMKEGESGLVEETQKGVMYQQHGHFYLQEEKLTKDDCEKIAKLKIIELYIGYCGVNDAKIPFLFPAN